MARLPYDQREAIVLIQLIGLLDVDGFECSLAAECSPSDSVAPPLMSADDSDHPSGSIITVRVCVTCLSARRELRTTGTTPVC